MISLATATLLFCSGNTIAFDSYLKVDLDKKSIVGTMVDTDASHGVFDVNYENLTRDGDCLNSAEVKFCLENSRKVANIEIFMPVEDGLFLETGTLICSEKAFEKKLKSKR